MGNFDEDLPIPPNKTLVNIAAFFPQVVMSRMTRKNGTKFHFLNFTGEVLLRCEIIERDVLGLSLYGRSCAMTQKRSWMRLR